MVPWPTCRPNNLHQSNLPVAPGSLVPDFAPQPGKKKKTYGGWMEKTELQTMPETTKQIQDSFGS